MGDPAGRPYGENIHLIANWYKLILRKGQLVAWSKIRAQTGGAFEEPEQFRLSSVQAVVSKEFAAFLTWWSWPVYQRGQNLKNCGCSGPGLASKAY